MDRGDNYRHMDFQLKMNKTLRNFIRSQRTYALATITQSLALAFTILVLSVSAQKPTVKEFLTVEEQQQWTQLLNVEKQRADALNQANNDLLNTQPGPDSVTVHARYQSAWLALRLAQSQRGEWLARVQSAHNCPDCAVSADGKALVSPPKATQ